MSRNRRWWMAAATTFVIAAALSTVPASANGNGPLGAELQSLDGSGNNREHPSWGQVDTEYPRVAPARFVDGVGEMVDGPAPRKISNRVFNDGGQQLYSPRGMSQWGQAWGQFLLHTVGQRVDTDEAVDIPYDAADPLETVESNIPFVPAARSRIVPGTGVTTPREPVNVNSSYVDAFAVYGGDAERLEWLREGPVDGNLRNNGARLLLPGNLLPRLDARGDADSAPVVDIPAPLLSRAVVAGDIRASENIGLTGVQTLFAREHNRIVAALPSRLSEEQKFQIARRVVIATEQYITYQEFLPTLGVKLPRYTGYRPEVDAGLGNEFATVGYRIHSMVRSDFGVKVAAGRYSPAQLDEFRAHGFTVTTTGDEVTVSVPSEAAAFNPAFVGELGLGPLLQGLAERPQAKNDEQIGDIVRNILVHAPDGCELPAPGCRVILFDIGAIDIARGRDHGMPTYNQLRQAYGLAPKPTFRSVTGEKSEVFPADPELTPGDEINDPDSLDFVRLLDSKGKPVPPGSDQAVAGVRRTPLAARLAAIYGSTSDLDAVVGMASEPNVANAELGELQLAIVKKQFRATRDGDRFFHLNDPSLARIRHTYGIDYRRSLADLIALNTDVKRATLPDNVFLTGRP